MQLEGSAQSVVELDAPLSGFPADPNYSMSGPFRIARLPRLEHTCHKLFPQCLGTQCLLRLDVFCPKGGSTFGKLRLL